MSDDDLGDGFDGLAGVLALVAELPGGSALGFLVRLVPAVRQSQARRLIDELAAAVGSDAELRARLVRDGALCRLVADAVEAAALADTEAKLCALARITQVGVDDPAQLDEARFVVGIVAELQVIHLRALIAAGRVNGAVDLREALDVSEPIAEAIVATLHRLSLANVWKRDQARLTRGSSYVSITVLGRRVLDLLGDGDAVVELLRPPSLSS